MKGNHWLVKQEAESYSWDDFVRDGRTSWTGVRNYQARNNLRGMKKGDLVLWYHSNEGKEIVGIAKVSKEAYQDPTTEDTNWVVVNLKPFKSLKKPVTLEKIKQTDNLQQIGLIKQGRLSVMGLTPAEFDCILALSEEK